MGIKENANQAREQYVARYLGELKGKVVEFEMIGLHLLDAPVSGLAEEFAKFHDLIDKAEKSHEAFLAKKYGPPQVGPTPASPLPEAEVKVDIPPAVQS